MNTLPTALSSVLTFCLGTACIALMPVPAPAQDITPPELTSATMVPDQDTQFRVQFSEPVYLVAATDPFNYYVGRADDGPFDFYAVSVLPLDAEGASYEVTMDGPFEPEVDYVVRAETIWDLAGNNVIPNAISIQTVPEPGVIALGALGLLGVWAARPRRHAS